MSCREWQHFRLGDLMRIRRGASPRPIHNYISSTGIPWIKIADATASNSRCLQHTKEYIREEGATKSVRISPGTLILSNSATPGIPKFVRMEACVHDGWLILDQFKGIDELFLYYLLLQARATLASQATGTVFNNLKTDTVREYEIKLPPISEQGRIAATLSCLDDKIELNNRMNKTLEEMAQAIFKSWFADFDPVRAKMGGRDPVGMDAETAALFPDEFEESELGPIPKGWRVGTLGDRASITMGQSPPGSSYNTEGMGIVFYQGSTDFGFRFPSIRLYTTEPKRMASKGDILFSVRAPVGDINVAGQDCCIGRGLAAISSRNGSFMLYQLRGLKESMGVYNSEGTVFGSINKNTLHGLRIIVPPEGVVDRYESICSSIDAAIETKTAEVVRLTFIRDTLLPKLMSGELRVPEAEKLLEEVL